MSASKLSRDDRRKKKAREAVKLPDDEAIRKLFPKKAVEIINQQIGHTPKIYRRPRG